ncbi:MAG: amidohydrolase family protein [Alphaproteobacteria bacterium]
MAYPYKAAEKWDVHTHTTLSPDTFEALGKFSHYTDFIRVRAHATKPCCAELVNSKGEVQRVIEHNAYDAAERHKDCQHSGVTMQVLSPTPMMIPDYVDRSDDAAEICRILNDDNASMVARFPDRFMALGALPMMDADRAIKEMGRIKKLGMCGVEINSNIADIDLDHERFFPIFEAAQELDMAVFIHPWGGFMTPSEARFQQRMNANRNWRPWLLGMGLETALAFDSMRSGSVHERLPELRVLYAHGGGIFPALLGRLEHGAYCRPDLFKGASHKNVYRTIRECGVYVDALTHNPWTLMMLMKTIGVNRIAMGSDYPYPLGEMGAGGDKGIYPGHMIEHLPENDDHMEAAWQHFHWLSRETADGPRHLPYLSAERKERMLAGTAKEWLGWQ